MALKDCIKKMERAGIPVSDAQKVAIENALAAGMTESQAIRAATLMAYQNVVDIANRARNEGATLAPFENTITKLVEFQARKLQQIEETKKELRTEAKKLSSEYTDVIDALHAVQRVRLNANKDTGAYVDVTDERQLLDAMTQLSFRSKETAGLKNLGLSGSALEMVAGYRKLEQRKIDIQNRFVELNKELEKVYKHRDAILNVREGKSFYQSGLPRLMVVHNLNAQKLKFADDLGGLAVPSLAVIKEGGNISGFGDITLIGTELLGDPAEIPIFDADGYTARFPSPDFKKPKAADRDSLWRDVLPYVYEWEGNTSNLGYYLDLTGRDHPNPQLMMWHLMDSNAVKAWYLKEVFGEDLTPVKRDVTPKFSWSWDEPVVEFFSGGFRELNYQWEDPRRRATMKKAGDVVKAAMEKSVRERFQHRFTDESTLNEKVSKYINESGLFNSDGTLAEMRFRELQEDVKRKNTRELDTLSNTDLLNGRIGTNKSMLNVIGLALGRDTPSPIEFKNWVEKRVNSMFGEPRLKVNGKWVDYNLENIVRSMTGKLKGTEFMDNMMNEGLMRAVAALRFKKLEQMRQRSELIMEDKDAVFALREESQAKMNSWIGDIAHYYTNIGPNGYVDHFEAGDAARRAVVRWATRDGLPTANDLEEDLVREGFRDTDGMLPGLLVDEGMEAAMFWMAVPVPYFEAKPQRAVLFEEFAGAIIPTDASADVRAILMKRGIVFKEYQVGENIDETQTRHDALTEFTQELSNKGERTLFQSDIGLTSGLLTAARTMPREKGTIREMLETLKKQPNVKQQELDAVDVESWMEGLELNQAMQDGIDGKPYNDKFIITRDQIIEFIDKGGVQVTETFYRGEGDHPTVGSFEPMENSDLYIDEDGEVQEGVTVYDARILNYNGGSSFTVIEDLEAGNVSVQVDDTGEWLDIITGVNGQSLYHAEMAIDEYLLKESREDGSAGQVRWTDWTLPTVSSGSMAINHREIVLHVPAVGGYKYLQEDLHEIGFPAAINDSREYEDSQNEKYWYIDASSPYRSAVARRISQIFQIPKDPYDTIEKAKQYIIDNKPVDAPRGVNFDSHAFPQENIIAWMRVNDRLGPNGEKILHVDETQSDLHQAGLTDGYNYTNEQKMRSLNKVGKVKLETKAMLEKFKANSGGKWSVEIEMNEFAMLDGKLEGDRTPMQGGSNLLNVKDLSKKQRAQMNRWLEAYKENEKIQAGGPTPNMPFKGDAWAELAMKRIIRLAVEGGYDQVTWTTGAQQLQRYDINEHFSEITWDPRDEMLATYDETGRYIQSQHHTMDSLELVFGAERVLELKRQIDIKRSAYDIFQVWLQSDVVNDEIPDNVIVLEDDDPFIGTYERKWMEGGSAYVMIDQNGEIVRMGGGDYQMAEYEEGIEEIRDDMAFGDGLPSLTAVDMVDEEGKGLRQRYDELMVNVTNRALSKLDKSVKVKRFGIQMEGGDQPRQAKIERKGGGALVEGVVDKEAFYVSAWTGGGMVLDFATAEAADAGRKQISPRFDTYLEARDWLDNMTRGFVNVQHGFDITEKIKVAAMEGQTLFQDKNRASITFQKEGGAMVRLSQSKDLSSWFHESAHLYLEMMADLAEMPDANPDLIDDYTKILKYLGVNKRSEVGTDQHELFARSFEAYLREGVAPTAELQPLFSTFKGWMIQVYKKLTQLLNPGEELNDEIRGVFDRLVATDAQIKASEDYMGYVALYATAEEMGISQRKFDMYRSSMAAAHDEIVDIESNKMIQAEKWAEQQWWREELKKMEAEVRAEAEMEKVYRALYLLQRGTLPNGETPPIMPFKLSGKDLVDRYGKEFMKRLPGRGKYSVYQAGGGVNVDEAAMMFGYNSGNELIQAMIKAPKMEQFIKDEAKKRMDEAHPNPVNNPDIINDATRAVHTNKRSRILAVELKAAKKLMNEHAKAVSVAKKDATDAERSSIAANKGQVPTGDSLAHIKAAANKIIDGKRIRDLNPNVYLMAERKAGRLAFEAMAKKDYENAYAQKRLQVINHEAYRAATRAKEQAVRDQKYLKSFDKKSKRIRMGKAGVLEKIDAVIEGINFRNVSNKKLDQNAINAEMFAAIMDGVKDGTLIVPQSVLQSLQTPGGINWKELTVEEFSGIRDVVKQLEHQGKTQYEIVINGERVIIQQAVDDVATSIRENSKKEKIPLGEPTGGQVIKRSIKEGIGHWLRTSSIARILDKSGFGAVTQRIVVPIRRAYAEKLIPRQHKAAEDIAAIYREHYSNDELKGLAKKIEDETLGEKMSKADILSIALNWGTEGNRAALLGGTLTDENGIESQAYPEQGVAQALARLDKRDWAFVQAVWDYEGSFYEEMAETEKRRRGIAPERVEALPFEIRTVDGEMISVRGGYHPLRYNSDHSSGIATKSEQKDQREAAFDDYFNRVTNGTYVSINTRAGATYERLNNHGKIVKLSLNTIDSNIRELIRDLTLGDEVNLVNRILNSKEVERAAKNTGNLSAIKELKLWLSDSAVGELPAQSVWEKSLAWTRVGFTKSKLAFNVYVTALQLTGIFQSAAVIGSRNYAIGVGKFISNPVGNYKMVMEKSKFMEARYGVLQTWDKDVQDTQNFLKSFFGPVPTKAKGLLDSMGHYYFYPIAKMQSVVDVTTWMGAYEKGINEIGLSEEKAGIYADTQVEASQTSGFFSDRSGIERGTLGTRSRQSQFIRMWTTLISYMLAKGNLAYETHKRTDYRSVKSVTYALTDYILLFMIEGIASSLLYGRLPGDDDDDQSVVGWLASVTAESVTSGIPMVREINAAKYASGNTPFGALVMDTWKFSQQVDQGEFDEAAIKAGVKVGGTLFHLPSTQVNRFVEAVMSDDDVALYEYFTGTVDK